MAYQKSKINELMDIIKENMELQTLRTNISDVEVSNLSRHGFRLYVKGKEYFLQYEQYPWFKNATISEILDVQLLHKSHLYWFKLDVDLEITSLEYPGKYPLVYQ